MQFTKLLMHAILLLAIDSIYLTTVSGYFNQQVKIIQGSRIDMNYTSAALCYGFLLYGWYYFIHAKKASILDAFILGSIIYGIFETTNKAIFKKWSWMSVAIDTLWGGILYALFTYISRKFM